MSANSDQQQSFARAKAQYATIGVDVQAAMEKLKTIPISAQINMIKLSLFH